MTPLYEYKCPQCSEIVSKSRSMSDRDNPVWCGDCLVQAIRQISPVNATFKGSGFYTTDKGKR